VHLRNERLNAVATLLALSIPILGITGKSYHYTLMGDLDSKLKV